MLATLQVARGSTPFHRVAYQPKASTALDYLIVYQCAFLLRRFALPVADRVDFTSTSMAGLAARQWVVKNPKMSGMQEEEITDLTAFLVNGILNQLRSIPVGMRVDAWITAQFPDLADLQCQAITKQLNDNTAALRPDLQAVMPDQALAANISMSTAFALYWAERLQQPQNALPYQATGHLAQGRALLDLWHAIPEEPGSDVKLIDAWASKLGLESWYRWTQETTH
jgi:hypothetical protein